jgi:hypothetical protein
MRTTDALPAGEEWDDRSRTRVGQAAYLRAEQLDATAVGRRDAVPNPKRIHRWVPGAVWAAGRPDGRPALARDGWRRCAAEPLAKPRLEPEGAQEPVLRASRRPARVPLPT